MTAEDEGDAALRCETGEVSAPSQDLFVERDGVILAGSLWSSAAPPPSVIVMHPGSGPSDRHNGSHFAPIRSALLDAGHAVASFDKRGVGESTGSLDGTSIEQQARDLLACVESVIRQFPGVTVGAFGHSQGGWVVYEAAGTSNALDFVIANSGPAVSPVEQERHALQLATDGHVDQPRALALFDDLTTRARRRQPLAQVLAEVDIAEAGSVAGFASGLLADQGTWDLTSLLFAYDPGPALARIEVPLLAVFGADDPLVPIDESIEALRDLVNDDLLQVCVFDQAGHRLQCDGDRFVDGYLETIAAFATACSTPPPTLAQLLIPDGPPPSR